MEREAGSPPHEPTATAPPGSDPGKRSSAGGPPDSPAEPPAGFVKLAMRNMVRKGRQSLLHFSLTAVGLVGFLVLIAWLGRPQPPGG